LFFQVNGKAYFPAHSLACPNFPFVILEGIVIIEAQIKRVILNVLFDGQSCNFPNRTRSQITQK